MSDFKMPKTYNAHGTVHYIGNYLSAFELDRGQTSSTQPTNTLLWIGGLGDTLLSVRYPLLLPSHLPSSWRVVIGTLHSSGRAWGIGSIAQDADDMEELIAYLHSLQLHDQSKGKIVIIGHSTGCQDCMEFVVGPNSSVRRKVDGVILQAPVSDRQAIDDGVEPHRLSAINSVAISMCDSGRGEDCVPTNLTRKIFGRVAITARRWVDIASPGPKHDGADDYFSDDLSDERLKGTFGRFGRETPLCILHMGADPSVPKYVNKKGLIEKWTRIVESGGGIVDRESSGIVAGATHNLNGDPDEVVEDLLRRVGAFIAKIDRGSFGALRSNSRI